MIKSKRPVELVRVPVTGSPFVILGEGYMPIENRNECDSAMVPKRYSNPLFDINMVYKHYKQNFGDSGMVVLRFEKEGYAVVAMPVPAEPETEVKDT